MAKIHIEKSEATKRAEERRARTEKARQKEQPTNADIMQILVDIWDELRERG